MINTIVNIARKALGKPKSVHYKVKHIHRDHTTFSPTGKWETIKMETFESKNYELVHLYKYKMEEEGVVYVVSATEQEYEFRTWTLTVGNAHFRSSRTLLDEEINIIGMGFVDPVMYARHQAATIKRTTRDAKS